jgi:hypothetical protein
LLVIRQSENTKFSKKGKKASRALQKLLKFEGGTNSKRIKVNKIESWKTPYLIGGLVSISF